MLSLEADISVKKAEANLVKAVKLSGLVSQLRGSMPAGPNKDFFDSVYFFGVELAVGVWLKIIPGEDEPDGIKPGVFDMGNIFGEGG